MPGAKKNFIGLEGFIWWIGVVEDRQDPEQLGRVRVRCFGWHTEKKEKIPTDALPWAQPVLPVNSPNTYTPKEGDMCFGFFVDGDNAQNPVIVGVFPGKPDKKPNYQFGFSDPGNLSGRPKKPDDSAETYPKSKYLKESTANRLSRGKSDSTIIATRKKNLKKGVKSAGGVTWSEPQSSFSPKYPYNNALETESGHALEFDDTPGKERVHLAHRNGSYIEIDTDGNRIERVQKDHYTVVMGSDYVYIDGKCSVTVGGDCNLKVGGNMNIEVGGNYNLSVTGDIRMKSKKFYAESTSDMNINALGVANLTANKKLSLKGATAALQGDTVDIPAAQINMQSGSATSASGTGLSGGGSSPSTEDAAEAANTNAATAASNAATATANTSELQEVTVTGKKVESGGLSVGKSLSGITSSISNVFKDLSSMADGLISNFVQNSPLGELTQKVANFEASVNGYKGDILNLKGGLKETLIGKIDDVAVRAAGKNIEFNVDPDLRGAGAVQETITKIGKRLFPKTETLEEVQITSKKTSSNTSGG
jgi:hypothetical protein